MKAIYTGKKEEAGKSYIQKYKYLVCQSKSWKKIIFQMTDMY